MAKKKAVEEKSGGGESGSGRWMLTYLDMVTLLFGVFIILYAMSNVSKAKFETVAESLRMGFQGGRTMFGGPMIGGQTIMDQLLPQGSSKRYLYEKLTGLLKTRIQRNIVEVSQVERGIAITLASDIYFDIGSHRLKEDGQKVLATIVHLFKEIDYYIYIEGHTDSNPVGIEGAGREYNDNWELGAMRAINVLRYFEIMGIDPDKLSAHSYGMYRPAVKSIKAGDPLAVELKAINRRVEIIIATGEKYKKITNGNDKSDNWK